MSLLKTNEIQNYNGSSLTLTASTVSTSAQLNTGGNISVTGSLNVSDDSTTRTNLGLGTIATQDSDSITVTGGTATLGALTVSGSDSGDLVRITQTGSGNSLVVEDSTNPDSTPFVVDSSGNVGIGTSLPNRLLEVDKASGDAYIRFIASDTSGGSDTIFENLVADNVQNNYIFFGDLDDTNIGMIRYSHASDFMSFTTNASERMRIDSSGNVGIGDATPDAALDVVGNIHYTGTITDVSDRRLKENITDLTDSLNKVSQLEGKLYTLIADRGNEEDTTEYGFIAQNVQEVFPEAVKVIQKYAVDENGEPTEEELNYLGVSYIQLIAPMVEAIKELKAKNESQQSQIDALTARIEALETT